MNSNVLGGSQDTKRGILLKADGSPANFTPCSTTESRRRRTNQGRYRLCVEIARCLENLHTERKTRISSYTSCIAQVVKRYWVLRGKEARAHVKRVQGGQRRRGRGDFPCIYVAGKHAKAGAKATWEKAWDKWAL